MTMEHLLQMAKVETAISLVPCHRGLLMLKWGLLWLPGSGRLDEVQKWDRS